jgi:DNA-directed RNA polymerase sigma subunit (sigma70/sigma32)
VAFRLATAIAASLTDGSLGFFGGALAYSLEEIGAQFCLTRERIRPLEIKAIRKLRLHRRRGPLETFIG